MDNEAIGFLLNFLHYAKQVHVTCRALLNWDSHHSRLPWTFDTSVEGKYELPCINNHIGEDLKSKHFTVGG